jgi:uncharacterized protein YycO
MCFCRAFGTRWVWCAFLGLRTRCTRLHRQARILSWLPHSSLGSIIVHHRHMDIIMNGVAMIESEVWPVWLRHLSLGSIIVHHRHMDIIMNGVAMVENEPGGEGVRHEHRNPRKAPPPTECQRHDRKLS